MKFPIILILVLTMSFFLAGHIDLFEILYESSRAYEKYELDEIFSLILIFSGFLFCYSVYLNFSLSMSIKKRELFEMALHQLNTELEQRVAQRTAELESANRQLVLEMDERKRLEVRMMQKQKLESLGTMAGGISHDFNTLLGIILGYAGMIKKVPGDRRVREYCSEIITSVRRSKELIRQLTEFAAPAAIDRQPHQFHNIIGAGIKLLHAALPAEISISRDIRPAESPVYANENQLIQVILNLGVNAGHAIDGKGHILFRLKEIRLDPYETKNQDLGSETFFVLTVMDSGCGMEPGIIHKIFDPFFTTRAVGAGSGLGLSVVHGIIKAHGGFVEVDSTPGKGSSFHVYLPRMDDRPAMESNGRPDELPG